MALTDHVETQDLDKEMITRKTKYVVPGYSYADDQSYGINPVYQSLLNPKELKSNSSLDAPSRDRVANMEAKIISFVCEKRLSLSLTGDIVTISRELARDTKTLLKVKRKRTAAQYKLQFGVAKALERSMLSEITSTYFSLNLDEATSSNHHRVLTIVVPRFNQGKKEVVCEHLALINVPAVTTENILNNLTNLFKEKPIPCKNLLATLMESCNARI